MDQVIILGELTVVIGKTGKDIKDIKEEGAYDVSVRNAQFTSSQRCYSKGFYLHPGGLGWVNW